LATAFAAVDRGLRVVVAADAVASASPAAHAAVLDEVLPRLDRQIELAPADRVLAAWAR
jgi:nicotinamidase-related amidase